MKKYFLLFLMLLFIFVFSISAKQKKWPDLKRAYFGQKSPGENPELFMFGLITTLDVEYCISFLDQGRVCVFGRDDIGVQYTYLKDGRWTEPQKLPFDTAIEEWKHNTGPDDRTLYFMSPRPVGTNDTFNDMNIYKMEWTGSGWTEPAILPFLPTPRNFMKSIHPFHPMDRPISTAGHSEISRI